MPPQSSHLCPFGKVQLPFHTHAAHIPLVTMVQQLPWLRMKRLLPGWVTIVCPVGAAEFLAERSCRAACFEASKVQVLHLAVGTHEGRGLHPVRAPKALAAVEPLGVIFAAQHVLAVPCIEN